MHGNDAPPLLLKAAKRLEPLDPGLARETYRDAFYAALMAGPLAGSGGMLEVAEALRASQRVRPPSGATDLLLDGLAVLIVEGPTTGVPTLKKAVAAFENEPLSTAKRSCGSRWPVEPMTFGTARAGASSRLDY